MNSEIGDEVEESWYSFGEDQSRLQTWILPRPVMPKFCRKICCIFALLEDDADCRSFEALLSEGNDFVASAEFSGVARAEQEARNMAKLLIGSSVSMIQDTRKTFSKTSPSVFRVFPT